MSAAPLVAHPSTPTADWSALKYDVASQSALLHLLDAAAAIDLPASVAASVTASALRGLVSASLARSTWAKYSSGWKAFCEFEAHHDASFSWPLSQGVIRVFVVWCIGVRSLRPNTARAYLSAIRFVGLLRGFPPLPPKTDPLLGLILSGATHVPWVLPRPSTRRVVTFPLHLTIGHRIAGSGWDTISRQTVWAACTTAFFSSARLGELLSYPAHAHDPSADRYGEMFSSTLLPLSSFSSSRQNWRLRLASFSTCLRSLGTTVALSSPSRLSGASILRPA